MLISIEILEKRSKTRCSALFRVFLAGKIPRLRIMSRGIVQYCNDRIRFSFQCIHASNKLIYLSCVCIEKYSSNFYLDVSSMTYN